MYLTIITFVTLVVAIVYIEWRDHKAKARKWEQIGKD